MENTMANIMENTMENTMANIMVIMAHTEMNKIRSYNTGDKFPR